MAAEVKDRSFYGCVLIGKYRRRGSQIQTLIYKRIKHSREE